MFEVYKRGQGRYVRIATFIGAIVLIVAAAAAIGDKLGGYRATSAPVVRFGIPTVLVIGLGLLIFRAVNRQKSADFLIATESEMKKVSWSSRKEVVGSTKVVIVTTLILAALLFGVDILFTLVFRWLRITG